MEKIRIPWENGTKEIPLFCDGQEVLTYVLEPLCDGEELSATALIKALSKDNEKTESQNRAFEQRFRELIDSGADVNQRTSTGRTVLHELSHFEYSAEIFAKVICKGADPTVTDNNGHTVWDEGEIWGWGIIDNEESDRKIALLSAFAEIEKNEGK